MSVFFLLKLVTVLLWAVLAFLIWNILTRPLLMEKVFSLILAFLALSFWLFLNGFEFLPLVILLLYIGAISVLFLFVVMIINPDYVDLLNQKQHLIFKLQQRQLFLSQFMKNEKNLNLVEQTELSSSLKKDIVNSLNNVHIDKNYYSFFFFGLFTGSVLGGVFSWYQQISYKFILLSTPVKKLLTCYSFDDLEKLFFVSNNSFNTLKGFKFQFYYEPTLTQINEMIQIGLLLYTKYGIALIIIGLMLLVAMIGAIVLTLRQTTFVKRQNISSQLTRYSLS